MSHVTITLETNEKLQPKYKIVVPKKVKLPPDQGPAKKTPKASPKPASENFEPRKK